MPLAPVTVENFGGLNIITSPEQVGAEGAVALSNVDLFPGGFRTRPGLVSFSGVAAAAPTNLGYWHPFGGAVSDNYIIAKTNASETTPFTTSGAAGTTLAHAAVNGCYVTWDTPGTPVIYVGTQAGVYKFDGTAWTAVAGAASPYVALSPVDERLVTADQLLGQVQFSDPSDPETFDSLNFVQLDPDDGELVMAMVTWRDEVFVFKQTKFFIFGTPATDQEGNPEFLYRSVRAGIGCGAPGGACATPDGVYFTDRKGVYLTQGDTPTYISQAIEPWLIAGTYTGLPSISLINASLSFYERRLYIVDPDNQTTLVYDPALDAWMVWAAGITGLASVPPEHDHSGLYSGNVTTKQIAQFVPGATDDDGVNIGWSYQSGKYPLSDPGRVAVTQESSVAGGSDGNPITLAVTTDSYGAISGTLGVGIGAGVYGTGYSGLDQEGALFQHRVSGTSGATIQRVTHYVSFVKPAGIQ